MKTACGLRQNIWLHRENEYGYPCEAEGEGVFSETRQYAAFLAGLLVCSMRQFYPA